MSRLKSIQQLHGRAYMESLLQSNYQAQLRLTGLTTLLVSMLALLLAALLLLWAHTLLVTFVNVEVKLFGIDTFESPKSSLKIITLKITDYTDSFYTKIFFRVPDEFTEVMGKLKKDKWYRINGNVKYDEFSRDLVLNAKSMMEIKSKDQEVMDDAE